MHSSAGPGCVYYHEAKQELQETLEFLQGINTHAARSTEEAFEETLTVQRLGVPARLQPFFSNTNMIENLFSVVRKRTQNVKAGKSIPPRARRNKTCANDGLPLLFSRQK